MLNRLTDNPFCQKLIAQYDHLPKRDQQALGVLGIALIIGLIYFGVWKPATDFHDQALQQRENAEELLVWLESNRATLKRISGASSEPATTGTKPADGRELMALVTRTAGQSGLSLQRFEPSGDDAIRVWLEGVPFSQVASWLEMLKVDNGVNIDQASMDRQSTPGQISVRLTLTI